MNAPFDGHGVSRCAFPASLGGCSARDIVPREKVKANSPYKSSGSKKHLTSINTPQRAARGSARQSRSESILVPNTTL